MKVLELESGCLVKEEYFTGHTRLLILTKGGQQYSSVVRHKWGKTMINLMGFEGHQAVINYDPEIEMFRGEFVNLNGGADFYATDIKGLRKEGEISLAMFLDMCKKDGVEPKKHYSGKFNVRLSSGLHENLVVAAASEGKSINQWVVEALTGSIERRP